MENIWKIDINVCARKSTPRDLVQEQCEKLAEITNGKIIARVADYEGDYKSYSKMSNLALLANAASALTMESFDAQKELGESGDDGSFVYEFFISSERTPKYKYRICFLYYGALLYPVGITLEQSIANELGVETEFTVDSEEQFTTMLKRILGCDKLSEVLSNLLSINI